MTQIDDFIEKMYERADWGMIPDHMVQPMKDYIEYGWQPGSFLTFMLERNIYAAVWTADNINEGAIADWVKFIDWYVPIECQGSEEKVRDWVVRGGYRGKNETKVIDEISTP
jgi:hypothetical protein